MLALSYDNHWLQRDQGRVLSVSITIKRWKTTTVLSLLTIGFSKPNSFYFSSYIKIYPHKSIFSG